MLGVRGARVGVAGAAATSATIPLGWRVSRNRRDEATTLVLFVATERSLVSRCPDPFKSRGAVLGGGRMAPFAERDGDLANAWMEGLGNVVRRASRFCRCPAR